MMSLLVHGLGAWLATRAVEGRYSQPVAFGIAVLVSRLGVPTLTLALAGYAVKKLNEGGAFDQLNVNLRRTGRETAR